MKKLLLLLLFIPLLGYSQRDFDYSFYTDKMSYAPDTTFGHGLYLSVNRKIQKEANEIRIISTTNTGDCEPFVVLFLGWDAHSACFLYKVIRQNVDSNVDIIKVNPLESFITLENKDTKQIYY